MAKHIDKANSVPTVSYRPEHHICPLCQSRLTRSHILWRKHITFSTGVKLVLSWAYKCPRQGCSGSSMIYRSLKAETTHLWHRRFSRELVIRIGHRRFWHHQTRDELHAWLTQDLRLGISEREITDLTFDFLALLRAAQRAKIRRKLRELKGLAMGLDGMQPEKGNDCLYIVRELQSDVTLLATNLEESSWENLSEQLFEPLKSLANELKLAWHGIVSDAQESIRLAAAHSLPGVPHQACQSHCLRNAGQLTFEADRAMKTDLKAAFRQCGTVVPTLARLRKRIQASSENDPFRAVLWDYAEAMRSSLLEGGIAPFELGGVKVYEALEKLEASLERCQKKPTTCCYGV